MHIGLQIKLARVAKGLTQKELAKRIFKTRPLISHIEQKGDVNEKTLDDIRKVLNMTIPIHTVQEVAQNATKPQIQQKLLQQDLDFLHREIAWLKSENEVMRQLVETQKLLILRLKK